MGIFNKKKGSNPPPSSLPAASRNIHTSDGTPGPSLKNDERVIPSPGPGGPNGSMQSLNSAQAPYARRERSESEAGARPQNLMQQVPHANLYPWQQRQLVFRGPQQNPFPRYGVAVNAVASKDGDIYLMGGLVNGSSVKGDLWMVEATAGNLMCNPLTTLAEGPGPRVGHASLLVGNAFIVFGGDTKVDETDPLDDTLYLLNTSSRQWSRASPPGPKPAGRYGHTLNILGSKIYIFGGQVEGEFFNDLIAFDLNALQNPANHWEFLIPNTSEQITPTVPAARTNHTVISHNDQLYLFGGTDGVRWFNDVWTYDPRVNRWSQLDCIGYIPAAREGHAAALVNDVMYIFGGRTEKGDDLGDLAAFRISLRRWYTFQNMGPSPSPRSGHSMTAHGKQIIVLAGEPSSAPRDPAELSLAYILDTGKIRYPNDAPGMTQTQKAINGPPSPTRRPSSEMKQSITSRSTSREGYHNHATKGSMQRNEMAPRDVMNASPAQQLDPRNDGPGPAQVTHNSTNPRIPRASISQTGAGPPPSSQAPAPRVNGTAVYGTNQARLGAQNSSQDLSRGSSNEIMRNEVSTAAVTAPTQTSALAPAPAPAPVAAPSPAPAAATAVAAAAAAPASALAPTNTLVSAPGSISSPPTSAMQSQRESMRQSRDVSPSSQGRRTPNHQPVSKAKAMEAGEAAPLVGGGVARQRSLRSSRTYNNSVDGSEDPNARLSSSRRHSNTPSERNSRVFADEPRSPRVTPHQEALIRELDAVKRQNAWYVSELGLAKKAGFAVSSNQSLEDKNTTQFSDEDKPLVETFMAMRAEMVKMQQSMEQQAGQTAKKIAEVEHQRDAAITEAAYARAKLAAHGGSQRSTPQLDGRRVSEESERATDISRRLALALSAVNEHKIKIDGLQEQLNLERRDREFAEETAEAAQRRLEEVGQGQNHGELEAVRAELHQVQSQARSEAGQRLEAEQMLHVLRAEHAELSEKHKGISGQIQEHTSSMAVLEAAVVASTSKAGLYEKQLEGERAQREALEIKLSQLKSEHENRTQELETTSKRLRDAEQLAESHATEAATHREALVAGLAKLSNPDRTTSRDSLAERRLVTLQDAANKAHELARANEQAAEAAAQKLRAAEERIAGLETYQEQSSREGLQIRRQLQVALREAQTHQIQNRELVSRLESQQHDARALSVQHSALKDLLGERGIDMSSNRRSPAYDSPGSPDQTRFRELQGQLEASVKAHEETRTKMETSQQEAERTFREKLEQLENDYQSLVTYVRGMEKMSKKMKEELNRYRTQNQRLTTELETNKDGQQAGLSADAAAWSAERDALQSSIDNIKKSMAIQIDALESNMASLQHDLTTARGERDVQRANHEKLVLTAQQRDRELAQLKSENAMLEDKARDAEHRVTVLLDQVGQSIGDMRRRSQMPPGAAVEAALNGHGHGHERGQSTSTMTDTSSHDQDGELDNRGSLTLDNLASELETLRTQWENTSRSYRLSSRFDFEKTPTSEKGGAELSESLASWKKKLDEEETDDEPGNARAPLKS